MERLKTVMHWERFPVSMNNIRQLVLRVLMWMVEPLKTVTITVVSLLIAVVLMIIGQETAAPVK